MQHINISLLLTRFEAKLTNLTGAQAKSLLARYWSWHQGKSMRLCVEKCTCGSLHQTLLLNLYLYKQKLTFFEIPWHFVYNSVRICIALKHVTLEWTWRIIFCRHARSKGNLKVLDRQVLILQETTVLNRHIDLFK